MTRDDLKIGNRYNWKNQPERLLYIGKHRDHSRCPGWFQFAKLQEPDKVWCEVRESDLGQLEATKLQDPDLNSQQR